VKDLVEKVSARMGRDEETSRAFVYSVEVGRFTHCDCSPVYRHDLVLQVYFYFTALQALASSVLIGLVALLMINARTPSDRSQPLS
jgi:hypothetical protein